MKFTSKKQKNVVNEVEMTSDEIADFKRQLFAGEVKFKFMKKDGTLREARGTTCPDLLPLPPPERQYDNNALQRARPARIKPANIICFYDLDAQGWRSFDSNYFEGIIEAVNEDKKIDTSYKYVTIRGTKYLIKSPTLLADPDYPKETTDVSHFNWDNIDKSDVKYSND